jgi:hypothetical protein
MAAKAGSKPVVGEGEGGNTEAWELAAVSK